MSIDSAVNTMVNNLFDQLGEVISVMKPVVTSVGSISQTVIQETSNAGFCYVMVGIALCCLAALSYSLFYSTSRLTIDKEEKAFIMGWAVAGAFICGFIGILFVAYNLMCWVAPTKTVILEIIDKIT